MSTQISIYYSIGVLLILSTMFSIFSKYTENIYPFHDNYRCGESHELCPTNRILWVRFLHYMTTFYFVLYYFIFDKKYDFYYIVLYLGLVLHWLITDECLLSKWEMSYYKEKDVGSLHYQSQSPSTLLHPHVRVFVGSYTDYIILFQGLCMSLILFMVILRYAENYPKYSKYTFIFGWFSIIIMQTYLMLKDRMNLFNFF